MKVLLYLEGAKALAKSGVGMALNHQKTALEMNGIEYTTDPKDDYDIAHINTSFVKSYRLAKKAKRKGKKVVVHAHSTMEDFRNSFKFSNVLAPLVKKWLVKMYNTGDVIITPTEYSKKLLEGYGIKKPIYVVSNGIDLEFFKSTPELKAAFRQEYNYTNEDKIVMGVGLYLERKGILDFVELAKRLPQYKFIWFGYLDLKLVPDKIRVAVQTKLPNLHFAGYVQQDKLRHAFASTDLFLFATQEETEGIVILEALASKQNVLVRDIPIYKEWIPEDKGAYKARNIDEFESKIKDILEGKLPNLTEQAYYLAEEKDIKHIGIKLKEIYENLLKNKNSQS